MHPFHFLVSPLLFISEFFAYISVLVLQHRYGPLPRQMASLHSSIPSAVPPRNAFLPDVCPASCPLPRCWALKSALPLPKLYVDISWSCGTKHSKEEGPCLFWAPGPASLAIYCQDFTCLCLFIGSSDAPHPKRAIYEAVLSDPFASRGFKRSRGKTEIDAARGHQSRIDPISPDACIPA